ncbi:hypothetical protein [Spirosoma areae]
MKPTDQAPSVKPTARRAGPLATIASAGFTAGLLDALGAILIYCVLAGTLSVQRLFQFIASGAVGPSAFGGNWPMAALGLFFHFLIALIFAAIYYVAATQIRFLRTQPSISGLLFGAFIWLTMNFVVVPLSAIGGRPFALTTASVLNILWHLFFIGLPIALITARRSRTLPY